MKVNFFIKYFTSLFCAIMKPEKSTMYSCVALYIFSHEWYIGCLAMRLDILRKSTLKVES